MKLEMAILTDTPTGSSATAKAHVRYIQHRRGKDDQRITRTLFGFDGAMSKKQAYEMIDEAKEGSWFYRFVLSPDPKTEDTGKDLQLWEITQQTMLKLEESIGEQVQFVGAIHADHTNKRHVHFLTMVSKRIPSHIFQDLRITATEKALFQRKELDLAQSAREREKTQETNQGLELSR